MYSVNMMECTLVAMAATMIRKTSSDVRTSFYLLLTNLLISDFISFVFDLIAIVPHMFTCQNIFCDEGALLLGSGRYDEHYSGEKQALAQLKMQAEGLLSLQSTPLKFERKWTKSEKCKKISEKYKRIRERR
uniref:Uncharacterized protein n=1 Tax=Romanomermis culicivorax TaxID=13658 RepID=A0A915KXI4_ROMCU